MENFVEPTKYGIERLHNMRNYEIWSNRIQFLLTRKNLIRYIRENEVISILKIKKISKEDERKVREDKKAQQLIIRHLGDEYIYVFVRYRAYLYEENRTSAYLLWQTLIQIKNDELEKTLDSTGTWSFDRYHLEPLPVMDPFHIPIPPSSPTISPNSPFPDDSSPGITKCIENLKKAFE